MTADRILSTALTLTGLAKPTSKLTVPKLAAFLNVGEGDVLAALKEAPAHVQRAWGLTPGPVGEVADAPSRVTGRLHSFRLPRR